MDRCLRQGFLSSIGYAINPRPIFLHLGRPVHPHVRGADEGWADIKNDMLSLQSISGKHNQTPKEWSCQSETGGNFLEKIQFYHIVDRSGDESDHTTQQAITVRSFAKDIMSYILDILSSL